MYYMSLDILIKNLADLSSQESSAMNIVIYTYIYL